LEIILLMVVAGLVLLAPAGAVFGILAFRRSSRQAAVLEELHREVARLRQQLADREPEPSASVVPHEIAPQEVEPESVPVAVPPEPSGPGRSRAGPSLETRLITALKANWMVWLGGLSVSLAGIFMVSHSITAGLLGPVQQFALALLSGLALHTGAEYLRRRHRGTAEVFAALAGGGSITLYAALLAGLHYYELYGVLTALILLAVLSLATMVLALLHGPLLAVMGLFGAYVVPLLVGGESGSLAFVLAYSFVITLSSALLMQHVYRDWFWYGTLAGAFGWWLIAFAKGAGLPVALYLVALFVVFSAMASTRRRARERGREALLVVLLLWAASIAGQPVRELLLQPWLLMLPVAILAPQSRGQLWYLPWAGVLATMAGWLAFSAQLSGALRAPTLPPELHEGFYAYGLIAVVVTLLASLWRWREQLELRRWASLVMLAPVLWLATGWLLLGPVAEAAMAWAVTALLAGGLYGALAWQLDRPDGWRAGLVWALLAAHGCYSLAVIMGLQAAPFTLALSAQFVSLVWLARRYQAAELYWLLKLVLAVVVARLTFAPWLDISQQGVLSTVVSYGSAVGFAVLATWLAGRAGPVRPWLEGATLHLGVLFLGVILRCALYDGDIFVADYSLAEAAINTLLWGSVSIVYVIRARTSASLAWLYRIFARLLLAMAAVSYLVSVWVHNPWWSSPGIGQTPVFNLILLAYGGPVLLALALSYYRELLPRHWAQAMAGAALMLFSVLEIRHLWRGEDMRWWRGLGEGELYTYSVVGMIYATVAILYSSRRNSLRLHKAGMTLLGLMVAKVFLVDMAGLQGLWRVAAFMGLGLALLGLAWVYRRTGPPTGTATSTAP